jgi:hypothetical protein
MDALTQRWQKSHVGLGLLDVIQTHSIRAEKDLGKDFVVVTADRELVSRLKGTLVWL